MPNESPLGRALGVRSARALGAAALAAATLAAVLLLLAAPLATAGAQQRDSTRDTTHAAAGPRTRADSLLVATDTTPGAVRRQPKVRTRRPAPTAALPDSLARPPISPRRAFLYSLAIPGQGQTALRRPKAAALFATIELASIAMLGKSRNDLAIARAHRADSVLTAADTSATGVITRTYAQDPLVARIRARRLHVEDWVATLLFNHLFSGADAFVAANLWDLPAQVSFRPIPRGVSVTASIPW